MKTTMKKLGFSTVCAAMLFTTSVNAGSVGGFGGALEGTQWARFGAETADRASAYAKQLQQYATQLQQYYTQMQEWQRKVMGLRMMVQNIGQLPENMKNQFLNMALQMKRQMQQGQAIAYTAANLDQKFRNTFKGFDQYLQKAQGGNLDFTSEYKNMYQTTKDTALNALKTLGIQERDLQSDQAFMSRLRTAMNTAQGTEAAIAVANQLSYHQTQSLQKLQKTIMTQANLEAEWIAQRNEQDAMRTAAREALKRNREKTTDTDDVPMP